MGFNTCSQFSWGGEWGKNVTFGDNSSSVQVDNEKIYLSSWLKSETRIRRCQYNGRS